MKELEEVIKESVKSEFDERLKERRPFIVDAVMNWMASPEANVKPLPDLPQRMETLRQQVVQLVENMHIELGENKLVVKVHGSDEETFKMFRLGTLWFMPHPEPTELFLTGFFDEQT